MGRKPISATDGEFFNAAGQLLIPPDMTLEDRRRLGEAQLARLMLNRNKHSGEPLTPGEKKAAPKRPRHWLSKGAKE